MPPARPSQPSGQPARKANWVTPLLLTLTLVAAVSTGFQPAGATGNLDAALLLLATVSSIAIAARNLPLQSVLFAAFITALIGGAANGLSARTGLPFGPLSYSTTSGPQLFKTVPWTVPLLWVVALFNSRGVARLMLRPWRRVKTYGFLLMGLTAALAVAFDFALEPFAHVKHLWLWQPTRIPVTWHGASPISFFGWVCVAVLILAIITPLLIRKQPGDRSGPDYAPLALWLGAIILFSVIAAQAGLWSALTVNALLAAAAALFSWRGARW